MGHPVDLMISSDVKPFPDASSFSFSASEHSAGCGGILHGQGGNVSSPTEEDGGGGTRDDTE